MIRCARCCLHKSMRIVNLIMNLLAIGMIVYSLWLLKMWQDGVSELPTVYDLPRPWFIYTCLGVGIAVCFSTLFGHMVANCINNSTLCIYIVTICSLLFLEIAVIVTIFFKFDWSTKIAEYIDENHERFKSFVIFHIKMCQFISLVILVPQIYVIALAVILCAIGSAEPRTHSHHSAIPEFTQSFLVISNSPIPEVQTRCACENLHGGGSRLERFLSYIKGLFRIRFRSNIVS